MSAYVHRCGQGASPCCPLESMRSSGGTSPAQLTVDVHCHVMTLAVEALVAEHPRRKAEPAAMLESMGKASVEHNMAQMLPTAFPKLTQIDQRLSDMDAMGVQVQVLSPSPNQYYYWAEPELAARIVRLQNEHIAALCAQHPTRLSGLGTVALQHPAMAAEQLAHAMLELGLKGVEISTSVEGRELDDQAFDPFWEAAEKLAAVVFIHPFGSSLGVRTATHYLSNTIGQPLETTLALSRLIFSGTLDRFPALKVLAAHGGGYLPGYIGRSNHAYQVRPEARVAQRPPGAYLAQLHFDTVVYEPQALRQLVDNVGASQVLLGTDYPYDMGHYAPQELAAALSADETRAVLGANARRLFNL